MTNSSITFGNEARDQILVGAERAAKAVISTLGPAGRNVAISRKPIQKNGKPFHIPPLITKDGVTVIDNIEAFEDPLENKGLQIVKEAARNTNRTGDGTTTATLLAYEMMKGGIELLKNGANAIHVKRGMDNACTKIVKKLESMKKNVEGIEELKSIATISSQDEKIGGVVAEAVNIVGKDGAITMQMGVTPETYYEITNGMQIPVGFSSHYFARNGMANLVDPFIIVTTEKIVSIQDLSPIFESIRAQLDASEESKDSPLKIVIFSTGVEGDALRTLAKGTQESGGKFQALVLNPPFFGVRQKEALEDIAYCTGAKLIDKTTGMKVSEMKVSDLGTCGSILASDVMTTIIDSHGHKDKIAERIALIQTQLDSCDDDNKDYYKARLAGLRGKIAKIYVGGSSQMEQKERMHRVEDAIAATKASLESGILPGGGVAFLRCKETIKGVSDVEKGERVVYDAMDKQIYWVCKNAGEDPEIVIGKVSKMKDTEGFNAETMEYGDMFKMRVIDPARVPIAALQNSVSVAGMFLTLEVAIDTQD